MIARSGSTLLELLVTMTIMAIVASVVALGLRTPSGTQRSWQSAVADARRMAVTRRGAVTIDVVVDDSPRVVTALPDGSVLADSALAFDRLTGTWIGARR